MDDGPTNLLRSRSDLVQQRVPHEAVDGEVVGVAVSAATPASTSISLFPQNKEKREEESKTTHPSICSASRVTSTARSVA
jgi:hypothetical protein